MLWTGFSQAQDNASERQQEIPRYTPTTGIRVALLGALIYPGFEVGVERPYQYTQIDKVKPGKTATFYKERYLSYSLGMYHHPDFHTNYFLQTEWLARRQKSKGFFYESAFGVGLSRTFVDGATFSVSDNGEVANEPFSGNWYGLASIGISIGYNANIRQGKPYSIYLKNRMIVLFPHNSLFNLRPTVELGFIYNLSGFLQSKPKYVSEVRQRSKTKEAQH
jgi:hypothetical protein